MAIKLLCNSRYKKLSVSDNARSWQIVSVICGIAKSMRTTLCLKKRPHFYFVKNEPISIGLILSVQNCDETWHQKIIKLFWDTMQNALTEHNLCQGYFGGQ